MIRIALRRALHLTALLALLGCGDDAPSGADATPTGADARVIDAYLPPDLGPRPPADERDAASTLPDVVVPDAGVPLDEPLAAFDEWGPAARVVSAEVPSQPAVARRAGCLLHGSKAGTGLAQLLILAGGRLDNFVKPDDEGRQALTLLLRASGWEAGLPASALDRLDLAMMEGVQGDAPEDLYYARHAFNDDTPEAGPRASWRATVDDGWFETNTIDVGFPLPLFDGPIIELGIRNARLTGRIAADGPGVQIVSGVLVGYMGYDDAEGLVDDIRRICTSEAAPDICDLIGGQIARPARELLDLVIGLVGGLDVRVIDGVPHPCDGEDCNALSACVVFEARGVEVQGVRSVEAP